MRKIRVDLDVCGRLWSFTAWGRGVCVCVSLMAGALRSADTVGLWGLWNQEVPSLLAPPSTMF